MATKKRGSKKGKAKRVPVQGELGGDVMDTIHRIPNLERAARKYIAIRDERMALQKQEDQARQRIEAIMSEAGEGGTPLPTYKHGPMTITYQAPAAKAKVWMGEAPADTKDAPAATDEAGAQESEEGEETDEGDSSEELQAATH